MTAAARGTQWPSFAPAQRADRLGARALPEPDRNDLGKAALDRRR